MRLVYMLAILSPSGAEVGFPQPQFQPTVGRQARTWVANWINQEPPKSDDLSDSIDLSSSHVDQRLLQERIGRHALTLRALRLNYTNVGDSAIEAIRKLQRLEILELTRTRLTD